MKLHSIWTTLTCLTLHYKVSFFDKELTTGRHEVKVLFNDMSNGGDTPVYKEKWAFVHLNLITFWGDTVPSLITFLGEAAKSSSSPLGGGADEYHASVFEYEDLISLVLRKKLAVIRCSVFKTYRFSKLVSCGGTHRPHREFSLVLNRGTVTSPRQTA